MKGGNTLINWGGGGRRGSLRSVTSKHIKWTLAKDCRQVILNPFFDILQLLQQTILEIQQVNWNPSITCTLR
jgi:hypothetical protein